MLLPIDKNNIYHHNVHIFPKGVFMKKKRVFVYCLLPTILAFLAAGCAPGPDLGSKENVSNMTSPLFSNWVISQTQNGVTDEIKALAAPHLTGDESIIHVVPTKLKSSNRLYFRLVLFSPTENLTRKLTISSAGKIEDFSALIQAERTVVAESSGSIEPALYLKLLNTPEATFDVQLVYPVELPERPDDLKSMDALYHTEVEKAVKTSGDAML